MSTAVPASPLRGRGILVTRPQTRAAHLCQRIREAGGEPVAFPTLAIEPAVSGPDSQKCASHIARADILVFVSPTAVEHGLAAWSAHLPSRAILAAVGKATAAALLSRGHAQVLSPESGADSEALAALPLFQDVGGMRIVIVRGAGGRDWLGNVLRARGATVEYAECYRRTRPHADIGPLVARWRAGGIAAVTITSREALDNLSAMLPEQARDLLWSTPLFVVHGRIAEHARSQGATRVTVTGAGDEALLRELQRFFATVA